MDRYVCVWGLILSLSLPYDNLAQTPANLTIHHSVAAHQLAEDYVGLVKRIMYTSPQYHLPQSQQQPHQVMSRSRAVSILECWNPREIALFEAGIWMHGKEFHKIALMVKTKSTKDVVAFYYIWKKTCHYQEWKAKYTSDDESESGDEEAHDE